MCVEIRCILYFFVFFFFFKQKTAYEMRISDWSSDVCSFDLADQARQDAADAKARLDDLEQDQQAKQAAVRGQMAEAQRQADEADASTATMQAQLQQVIEIGRASRRDRVCQYV